MQNLGRFYAATDFDREYLRNLSKYPKSERIVIENDSSRVRWKKSSELSSTNPHILRLTSAHPNGDGVPENFKSAHF